MVYNPAMAKKSKTQKTLQGEEIPPACLSAADALSAARR